MLGIRSRIRCVANSGIVRIFSAIQPFSSVPSQVISQTEPGLIDSLKYKMGIGLRYNNGRLKLSGENLYTVCAEYPEFTDFVEKLNLPDTFQTWFSLTTLHIWMCLVRLRREGQEGRAIRNVFIQLIWTDLKSRMKPFGIIRKQHGHVDQFKSQFFGSVLAYDEALLMHSDPALAAALWRNLFISSPDTSAEQLVTLVHYIRKQLAHLNSLSSDQIVGRGMPIFLRLNEEKINPEYANRRMHYCFTWPEWDK
nr:ubiquinol cytochrome c reductase complex [Hymenolepis microstoma]